MQETLAAQQAQIQFQVAQRNIVQPKVRQQQRQLLASNSGQTHTDGEPSSVSPSTTYPTGYGTSSTRTPTFYASPYSTAPASPYPTAPTPGPSSAYSYSQTIASSRTNTLPNLTHNMQALTMDFSDRGEDMRPGTEPSASRTNRSRGSAHTAPKHWDCPRCNFTNSGTVAPWRCRGQACDYVRYG